MDPSAMKVNNGCVNASLMDIPTEIKSIFDTETIPPGRNLPFLPRTLHRRFPSRKIIPQYLKVHLVTVKNHKYVVETRPYQRRRDIRCTLCSTKPHVSS